ncbi:mycobactin polyketide synthase MbtD [Mycolicibacterium pulveris]|uniref:mycobactin polyketide synthase MbtD n=1 Tax=Mycolicibacterium pulveris TaxID=36813 RepID=UPI003CFB270D
MPARTLPDGRVPVVLSAHAEELIASDAEAILHYLDRGPDVHAVAATLLRTRRLRRHRAVLRAANADELADGLRALSTGADHPLLARSSQSCAARTAFVLPGQGNQWPSMGAEAYHRSPVYRAEVDRCAEAFAAAGQPSPLPYLIADTDGGTWPQVQIQAAQFTHAAGLAQVWRSCGIRPDIAVGHSLGEVAAAYLAGTMTLADAAAVVIARAEAVESLSGDYGMAALGISVEDAQRLIASIDGWLEISAVNSSSSVVVSGRGAAVEALVAAAAERGHFVRSLDVTYPGHTSALEPLRETLTALLPPGRFDSGAAEFIGSATADAVPAGTDFADYWYRNLRNTVRFDRAAAAAHQRGASAFVELSAHPSLLFALGDLVADGLIVGSGQRGEPFADAVSAAVVTVAVADPDFRWADLLDTDAAVLPGFPNAPMRDVRLWATPEPLAPLPGITVAEERWLPTTGAPAGDATRGVAVVELAGPAGSLADRLRDAVRRHPGAQNAAPHDADVLVAVAPVLDHPDAELAAQEIAKLVDTGLLDYVDTAGPRCPTVCLVTVGGEQVRPDEPVALPAQAALAAMHRSLGYEHPDQTFRRVDLPAWQIDDTTAAVAVDAVLGDGPDAAVRDGTTYVRTVTETVQAATPWPLGSGVLDNVVITGGSGTVGLHFARYLAGRGARRIVLLSRSGIDEATRTQLACLGAPEVEIVDARCDITSAEQLSSAAGEHADGGATLLIHAAGAATFTERNGITGAAFADTAAAKVDGLARMMQRWPLRPDARILLCSSISGVWGGRGHGAYSAANRMLDVMAGQLRATGRHCVAARYGLWHGSGIAEKAGVASIERSGLLPMAPELAVAASLCDHHGDPLLMTADAERLRMFLDHHAVRETPSATTELAADAGVAEHVLAALTAVLKTDTIDPDMSLLDLGLDSLLALDLRKRLLKTTNTKVALATLLGGITAGELIDSLDYPTRTEKVETTRD